MPRTPVLVVSGALGSGKTTLVNHLLRTSGARVGLVINDFGEVDVDALLVAGQVDTTAISGGCLCCLADTSELDDALRRLARMDLDVVVIEASGLAEPRELARMVLASDVPGIRFGGVVEVLDASAWGPDVVPVALDHLKVATLLVLNKVDRAADDPAEIRARLARLAPGTPVVDAVRAAVAPDLMFDVTERPEPSGQLSLADLLVDEHQHDHHEHETFESVAVDGSVPFHPRRLVDLLDERPDGVVRVKGLVRIAGISGTVVVQAVGDWFTLERPDRRAAGYDRPDGLVVIGTALDPRTTRERLASARATPDEILDAADVYAAARFLRDRGASTRANGPAGTGQGDDALDRITG